MTTVSPAAATPPPTAQQLDAIKAAGLAAAAQNVGAATARAADGDYKTKGTGHAVKDADGDYKATATGAPGLAARPASATQAALASLVKGG